MEELMEMLECIPDERQQSKVRYTIKEILLIVFSATLSNVDDWEVMEMWAKLFIFYKGKGTLFLNLPHLNCYYF